MFREVRRELVRSPLLLSPEQVEFIQSPAFTRSDAWIRLRYDFIRDQDARCRCRCCGRRSTDGVKINADHVLPRRTHPELALCYANLQVLCSLCNRGKGNRDQTDWRFRTPPAVVPAKVSMMMAPSCPACRAPMRRRDGSRGAFWGCSRFPTCRATKPAVEPRSERRRNRIKRL
ncbi:MAG: topoisomerase DNA-binding C4 zinc finger domain-containing protein [Nitrospiraceae bacterium]